MLEKEIREHCGISCCVWKFLFSRIFFFLLNRVSFGIEMKKKKKNEKLLCSKQDIFTNKIKIRTKLITIRS